METKRGRGRPRIEIDADNFKKLCGLQCTLSEIASFFSCSDDTIERWCQRELKLKFAEAFKMYSASGKISLRRWQFRMAENSVPMAIWLGKQYLGQREQQEVVAMTDETVKELHEYIRKREGNETFVGGADCTSQNGGVYKTDKTA